MPMFHWALSSINQQAIATGFKITTTTDVPCHQWLRHTLKKPWSHPKPVSRRGLFMMYDARFCFVAFEDIEQNEEGDTTTHTFTWPGWTVCQTRYFYFWATIAIYFSPSTSCIFSLHYQLPPPLILKQYHDAPCAGTYGCSTDCRIGQSFTPQSNYPIKQLDVKLMGLFTTGVGIWHIEIRTNDDYHPSETVLWSTTINSQDISYPDCEWFEFPVTGVDAQTDVPLWIVMYQTDYTYGWLHPAACADGGNLYPRGEALTQSSPGETWQGMGLGGDWCFRIWSL